MAKYLKLVEDDDSDEKPTKIGGYKAQDILKAPVQPIEPVKTEGKKATSNPAVVILITGAALLGICGLILVLFGLQLFGSILLFIAAGLIVAGVFLPIH